MKLNPNHPCPCGRKAKFKRCCRPFHRGAPAPDPESLMRSRYSAYAAGAVEYILKTTHPAGPHFRADRERWAEEVEGFCTGTSFCGLEVLDAETSGDTGFVSFRVRLTQSGQDASFGERSTFQRLDGRWLYHSGHPLDPGQLPP